MSTPRDAELAGPPTRHRVYSERRVGAVPGQVTARRVLGRRKNERPERRLRHVAPDALSG
jgi:hypothetical protein